MEIIEYSELKRKERKFLIKRVIELQMENKYLSEQFNSAYQSAKYWNGIAYAIRDVVWELNAASKLEAK